MFKDDYRNQIENIKPDEAVKDKIRQKLKGEKPQKRQTVSFLGKSVAVALSLCIVFTLGAVFGRGTAPKIPTVLSSMERADDYDKIYETLSVFKPTLAEGIINYFGGTKDTMKEEWATAETTAVADGVAEGSVNKSDHSETTTQVSGVDEADVIKTDGENIYILSRSGNKRRVKIVKSGESPSLLSEILLDENLYPNDMYLKDDRLVVLCSVTNRNELTALIYDISSPEKPKKLDECTQSGYLNTSRLIGTKLYLITNLYVNVGDMVKSDTESYMPYIKCAEYDDTVEPKTVHFYDDCNSPQFTVISAFDIKDSSLISTQSVLGGTETVYAGTDNIIVADMPNGTDTQIARFKIQDGVIELKASAELKGRLLNQFSIDEYKEHFRFVLTEDVVVKEGEITRDGSTVMKAADETTTLNSLVILDGNLKETGKITDIAPNERVYSVRFMGDTAYFVTFRQVDPLFSVDVSDPNNPKIIGALKIPGFSNYLFPYGEGKLLGIGQNADETTGRTQGMKLSMFNISDPANVTESNKTDIPAAYSEALYNHRAVLCDYEKNIIAFAGQGYYNSNTFFVYAFENGEFVKRLEAEISQNTGVVRGIYIGKIFYIVSDYEVMAFDMADFKALGSLSLK